MSISAYFSPEGELTEEEWLQDLETTKAPQRRHELGNSEIGFCCLGRACVKDKRIKYQKKTTALGNTSEDRVLVPLGADSKLAENYRLVVGGNGSIKPEVTLKDVLFLAPGVHTPLSLNPMDTPWSWMTTEHAELAAMANDNANMTFKEIAAWWRGGKPVDIDGIPERV